MVGLRPNPNRVDYLIVADACAGSSGVGAFQEEAPRGGHGASLVHPPWVGGLLRGRPPKRKIHNGGHCGLALGKMVTCETAQRAAPWSVGL